MSFKNQQCNGNVIILIEFSPQAAVEVVVSTYCGAASVEHFIKWTYSSQLYHINPITLQVVIITAFRYHVEHPLQPASQYAAHFLPYSNQIIL